MNRQTIIQRLRERLPNLLGIYAFGSRIQGTGIIYLTPLKWFEAGITPLSSPRKRGSSEQILFTRVKRPCCTAL